MKNSKDIMHVKELYNKRGELRYELYCSGKDRLSQKNKVYTKTIAVPLNLKGKKEVEQFRLQCQIDFKKQVEEMSCGLYIPEKVKIIPFCDYAQEWVDNIIKRNPEAYHHYSNCMLNMKVFREKFSKYTVQDMGNLKIIRDFVLWLCTRTYKKEVTIVKNSIRDVIKEKNLTFSATARDCNISLATLKVALVKGNHVTKDTAKTLCQYLNIPINNYFSYKCEQVPYSLSANRSLKIMLGTILSQAVYDGLIPINYCQKPYIKEVTGIASKPREIYRTNEEVSDFIAVCCKEQDIRKKVAFLLSVCAGTRGCELAGLTWDDIDFEKNLIKISKGTMYVYGFGVVEKNSTKNGEDRVVGIPENVMQVLKEYKEWWQKEKIAHGNLWANTNKLFVKQDGKPMANDTIADWLRKFEKENNLKHVTIHGLRSTNISYLVESGNNIETVAERVGHKDSSITLKVYTQSSLEANINVSKKLNSELFANV